MSGSESGGISGLTLLGIVFVTLKLCHVINWSWWWVTAPFWAGLAVFILILFTAVAAAVVGIILGALRD